MPVDLVLLYHCKGSAFEAYRVYFNLVSCQRINPALLVAKSFTVLKVSNNRGYMVVLHIHGEGMSKMCQ
jgi:hypothetical protein